MSSVSFPIDSNPANCTIHKPWFPSKTLKIDARGVWMSSPADLSAFAAYRVVLECTNKYNYTNTLYSDGFVVDTSEAPLLDLMHEHKQEDGRNGQTSETFTAGWTTTPPAVGGFKRITYGAIDSTGKDFAPPSVLLRSEEEEVNVLPPLDTDVKNGTVWVEVTTQTGKVRRSYTDLGHVSNGFPCIGKITMSSNLNSEPQYLTSLDKISVSAQWRPKLASGSVVDASCTGRKVVTHLDGVEEHPIRGEKASNLTSKLNNTGWVVNQLHAARVELWTSIIVGYNITNLTESENVTYDGLPGMCTTRNIQKDSNGDRIYTVPKHKNYTTNRTKLWCETKCTKQKDCTGFQHSTNTLPTSVPCKVFEKVQETEMERGTKNIGYAKAADKLTCYVAHRSGDDKTQDKVAIFESLNISEMLSMPFIRVNGSVCCQSADEPIVGLFARSQADKTFEVVSGLSDKKAVNVELANDWLVVSTIDKQTTQVKLSITDVSASASNAYNLTSDARAVSLTAPSGTAGTNAVAVGGNTVAIVTRQALNLVNAADGLLSKWIELSKHSWTAGSHLAVSDDGAWVAISGRDGQNSGQNAVALFEASKPDSTPRRIIAGSAANAIKCLALSKNNLIVGTGSTLSVFSVTDASLAPLTLPYGSACDVRGSFAVAASLKNSGEFTVYHIDVKKSLKKPLCTVKGDAVTGSKFASSVAFMQAQNVGNVTVVVDSSKGIWVYEVREDNDRFRCEVAGHVPADNTSPPVSLAAGAHAFIRQLDGSTKLSPTAFDISYYCGRNMMRVPGRGCVSCPAGSRSLGGFHSTCHECGDKPYCVGKNGLIANELSVIEEMYNGTNKILEEGQEIWAEMVFEGQNGNEVVLTTGAQVYDPSPPVVMEVLDIDPVPVKNITFANGMSLQTYTIQDIDFTPFADRAVVYWQGCNDTQSGIKSARVCFMETATGRELVCKEDPKIQNGGTWVIAKSNLTETLTHGSNYVFKVECVNKAGLASVVRIQ